MEEKPDKSLAALKLIVLSLGVLLVGGAAILITGIYHRQQLPGSEVVKAHNSPVAAKETGCKDAAIPVPEGSHVEVIAADTKILTLKLEGGAGARIMRVNACTGSVINTLSVIGADNVPQ